MLFVWNSIFVFFAFLGASFSLTYSCKGCVQLDEFNFQKILSRFDVVLVKFDIGYPYGDKHDAFLQLASEVASVDTLIVGEVGVKDYGNNDNEKLAKEYGITKGDFPAIRLFVKGRTSIEYNKDASWTVDSLRDLLKDNTNMYIGLPGCLEKFDKLAADFVHSNEKEKHLKAAEKMSSELNELEQNTGLQYIKFMKKIIEVGGKFINQERERLNKILKGKLNDKKKEEITTKTNILRAFTIPKIEL